MKARKIGYARVSTVQQNLERQIGALRAARCDVIFREKASGKDTRGRPQLERAIDELGKGDILESLTKRFLRHVSQVFRL